MELLEPRLHGLLVYGSIFWAGVCQGAYRQGGSFSYNFEFFFHGGHISSLVKNMTTIIEMEGPFRLCWEVCEIMEP